MPYCVNCGVELSADSKKCPLCNTPVVCPSSVIKKEDENPLFPSQETHVPIHASKKSLLELITLGFIIPIPLLIFCDINITESITWSGFAVGAIVVLYVLCIVPLLFNKANPLICSTLDAIVILAYLYYIEYAAKGHWFLPFALPLVLTVVILLSILFSVIATKKAAPLTIIAIGSLLIGILCLCIEILINISFSVRTELIWSIYPFIVFSFWAIVLLYINRNTSLKEKLKRKFFI